MDRLKDDEYYSKQKTNMHKVLKNSTDKGTEIGNVTKYENTKYISMSYKYLKEYYKQ